jgi:hypothetical protein
LPTPYATSNPARAGLPTMAPAPAFTASMMGIMLPVVSESR